MKTNPEITVIKPDTNQCFSKVQSSGLIGISAYPVEIEVNISGGLPNFILVGLPDPAINESRERVRVAIKSSSYDFPSKKILVNLAPADTKKAGPTYDLPIAIGILACCEIIEKTKLENIYIVGELGLSGKVRPVNGVLSSVILAKEKNAKGIIVPYDNSGEASLVDGLNIYPVKDLSETINIINNIYSAKPLSSIKSFTERKITNTEVDFCDVKGQSFAKRALEISACGGHHVLMIGPPGSGKSMLSQRLTTILPPLNHNEKIEVTQIYSAAGKLNKDKRLISDRPFRSPHHNTSTAGLIGGGSFPQPGEISLAHKGVLFLDEFTEFQRQVLDSLRQALESKEITISRSRKSCTFPCDFILVSACNPCQCGYFGDPLKKCLCSTNTIKRYREKISGPILDRIDLQIEVKRLNESELISTNNAEKSFNIKDGIIKAKEFQKTRFKDIGIKSNSNLSQKEIKQFCRFNSTSEVLLKEAVRSFCLTARSFDRVLKVSRTIADLENSDIIKDEHILEALQFRLNVQNQFKI